jgi:6-phosphogluconolactonase
MKQIIVIAFLLLTTQFAQAQEYYLLVGTYTAGKSEGIYVFKFNSANGTATAVSSVKTSNPSYLAVAPDKKTMYAVNEDAPGNISAFSFDKKRGTLSLLNQKPALGSHPCYITTDKKKRWLIVGNYSSGNFVTYALNKNGSIDTLVQNIAHTGSGPDTTRQKAPHVHATVLNKNNTVLFVPDLGIDKIMTYHFNNTTGKSYATKTQFVSAAPGSGPRHIALHSNNKFLYLMAELTGNVIVYKNYGNTDLQAIQTISALPKDFTGFAGSADIHLSPDGKFLYCTNRGESNSISTFKVLPDGKLVFVNNQNVLGIKPRNFNFSPDGKYILVANQNSDAIIIFTRDVKTGLLTATGNTITVPSPVCLQWIK